MFKMHEEYMVDMVRSELLKSCFLQRLLQMRLIRTEYLKLLRFVAWGHILTLDVDAYEFP